MAHCNTSNTCCNRHAPSRHRCHQQPALFSATDPTYCLLVSRWPPLAFPPVVGDTSSALDGAGSPFHFEALFSFLRAVVGFNLGCVAAADSAEPESRRRCPRDAQRWLRTALAIVMLSSACCVSTAQGTWSTAQLSVGRHFPSATSVGNVAIFAGGALLYPYGGLNDVDLYNYTSGTWSTAQLNVARYYLAATSVGNVAIFAGGSTGNCSFDAFC